MYMQASLSVYVYICKRICVYVHLYLYVHVYMYMYTYMYTYVYACVSEFFAPCIELRGDMKKKKTAGYICMYIYNTHQEL